MPAERSAWRGASHLAGSLPLYYKIYNEPDETDAGAGMAPVRRMSLSANVLQDFTDFFDGAPQEVRQDLSALLTAFASDGAVGFAGEPSTKDALSGFFAARTPIGKIGDLINAVGVVDVYFALDTGQRFKSAGQNRRSPSVRRPAPILDGYADWLTAIETARRNWRTLRTGCLSTEAIAAALHSPNGA
jgi:hypothetical protein